MQWKLIVVQILPQFLTKRRFEVRQPPMENDAVKIKMLKLEYLSSFSSSFKVKLGDQTKVLKMLQIKSVVNGRGP